MAGSKCRILVVEDEPDTRDLLSELLTSEGFVVDLAEDGLQALDRLREHSYALVLSDVRMPGMEGMDLLHEIRKTWSCLPVVLMTAFGDWQLYEDALREGAVDLIAKPFRRLELLKVLEHCLASPETNGSTGAGKKA